MLLPVHHRTEHDVLGQLLGLEFDHQHGVGSAGHHEVERALGHLVDHRVQHVLAADIADPGGGDRPEEGHAGQGQCGRGGHHPDDIRVVLHVVGEHGDNDLRLVLEARGE